MKSVGRRQLSVVMPVHNGLPFLHESISSILNQTFTDFELLILDDASTDGSLDALREWERQDDRIRVIHSSVKLGLAGSSNQVVSQARAEIVARMDADDISHRERLERQFEVLQTYRDVVAVGTLCDGIDASGRTVRPRDRWRLIRVSPYIPFPHGSAMFRRRAFDQINGYSDRFPSGEDQDFFHRMTALGRVVTLPDLLYHFRFHAVNTTVLTGAEGVHAVRNGHNANGQSLDALYMLGAMRLWAGQRPETLPELLRAGALQWNFRSLVALGSAGVGTISPTASRFLSRTFIRARDAVAALRIKDGRPYEWRFN